MHIQNKNALPKFCYIRGSFPSLHSIVEYVPKKKEFSLYTVAIEQLLMCEYKQTPWFTAYCLALDERNCSPRQLAHSSLSVSVALAEDCPLEDSALQLLLSQLCDLDDFDLHVVILSSVDLEDASQLDHLLLLFSLRAAGSQQSVNYPRPVFPSFSHRFLLLRPAALFVVVVGVLNEYWRGGPE